jgi:hypothetical protein
LHNKNRPGSSKLLAWVLGGEDEKESLISDSLSAKYTFFINYKFLLLPVGPRFIVFDFGFQKDLSLSEMFGIGRLTIWTPLPRPLK